MEIVHILTPNKSTDCHGKRVYMYFNNIYHGDKYQNIFDDLKPYLMEFISGKTVCVFNHGVTGKMFPALRKVNISLIFCFDDRQW